MRLLLDSPAIGGAEQPRRRRSRTHARRSGSRARGWNRIQLTVTDLDAEVAALRAVGASFRNSIVTGRGGRQIFLDDPAGNPVELFEPR